MQLWINGRPHGDFLFDVETSTLTIRYSWWRKLLMWVDWYGRRMLRLPASTTDIVLMYEVDSDE